LIDLFIYSCIHYTVIADTIPGRQCMASCFFLMRQFEDVLIYLNSVRVNNWLMMHMFMMAVWWCGGRCCFDVFVTAHNFMSLNITKLTFMLQHTNCLRPVCCLLSYIKDVSPWSVKNLLLLSF